MGSRALDLAGILQGSSQARAAVEFSSLRLSFYLIGSCIHWTGDHFAAVAHKTEEPNHSAKSAGGRLQLYMLW